VHRCIGALCTLRLDHRQVWFADSMSSILREAVGPILRYFLPYPDPIRRARFRGDAYKLLTCEPWPDDAKGPDAAQLALLRLLFLQRQVWRAVRWRQREAAALLARSAAETCIVGLYSLHSDDAAKALAAKDATFLPRFLRFLVTAGLVSKATVEAAAKELGSNARLPKYADMAGQIPEGPHKNSAAFIYDSFYAPLSHFFTHASGFTLGRHVRPDNRLQRKPVSPWPRRSPAHLTDACAGVLAAAIAREAGIAQERFIKYATAHGDRVMIPVIAVGGTGFLRSASWRRLPGTVRAIKEMRAYLAGPALADSPAEREARVRAFFTDAYQVFGGYTGSQEIFSVVVDDMTRRILSEQDSEPGSAQRPDDHSA
jgi:hypothetical protein